MNKYFKQTILDIIKEKASVWSVDPKLALAIATHESSLDPDAQNHGPGDQALGGAYGLFQLTLKTAQGLGFKGAPNELLDPETNANLGCMLLSQLAKRKGYTQEDVICAYNSGRPMLHAPVSTVTHYLPTVEKLMANYA